MPREISINEILNAPDKELCKACGGYGMRLVKGTVGYHLYDCKVCNGKGYTAKVEIDEQRHTVRRLD